MKENLNPNLDPILQKHKGRYEVVDIDTVQLLVNDPRGDSSLTIDHVTYMAEVIASGMTPPEPVVIATSIPASGYIFDALRSRHTIQGYRKNGQKNVRMFVITDVLTAPERLLISLAADALRPQLPLTRSDLTRQALKLLKMGFDGKETAAMMVEIGLPRETVKQVCAGAQSQLTKNVACQVARLVRQESIELSAAMARVPMPNAVRADTVRRNAVRLLGGENVDILATVPQQFASSFAHHAKQEREWTNRQITEITKLDDVRRPIEEIYAALALLEKMHLDNADFTKQRIEKFRAERAKR